MKITFDKDGAKNAIAWLLFYAMISIIADIMGKNE